MSNKINSCRVCVKTSSDEEVLKDITEYKSKFFDVTGINIKTYSKLCSGCLNRLNDAFAFREQAWSTHRLLELQEILEVKDEPNDDEIKTDSPDIQDEPLITFKADDTVDSFDWQQDIETITDIEPINIDAIFNNVSERKTRSRGSSRKLARTKKNRKRKKHVEEDTRPRNVGCTYCFKVDFESNAEKIKHIQDHINSVGGLECDLCGSNSVKYFTKKGLNRHMATAHLKRKVIGKKTRACPECGKLYESSFNLNTHLRIVHQIGPQISFCCEICGKSYSRQKTLKDHVKLVHQKIKNHECDTCHKKFADSHALKTHKLIHDNIRNHICPICQKAFVQKGNLMEHIESHNQIPKFPCDICGKLYRTTRLLQKHLNSHKIHRFECEICGQKFKMRAYLKGHMVSHSDRRDFYCEYCHKGFKTKEILKIHVRLHTGENMQECPECKKKYPDQFKLKLHINVAHRGMRFECEICGRGYSTQFGVTRHKQSDHKTT